MISGYWQRLSERERRLLAATLGLVALLLVYVGLIEPVRTARAELAEVVARTRTTYTTIQAAAAEAAQLRGGGSGSAAVAGASLVGQIDETARGHGLSQQMTRVEPSGKDDASVWLEQASFDGVVAWLEELEGQYGLRVKSFEAERSAEGLVSARVILGP